MHFRTVLCNFSTCLYFSNSRPIRFPFVCLLVSYIIWTKCLKSKGKSVGSFYFLSSGTAYGWPRMTMLCRLLPAAEIDTLICISPFVIFYFFIMERKNVREGGFLLENGIPFEFVFWTQEKDHLTIGVVLLSNTYFLIFLKVH